MNFHRTRPRVGTINMIVLHVSTPGRALNLVILPGLSVWPLESIRSILLPINSAVYRQYRQTFCDSTWSLTKRQCLNYVFLLLVSIARSCIDPSKCIRAVCTGQRFLIEGLY